MKDLFDFNHIDPTIDEETKKELEQLYKYYHKLWWCDKKTVERLKKTIAGAVTLNPIILGVITGTGLLIKTTSEIKKYVNKIEMFKIGLSTYEKTLVDLRSFLRGKEYSREDFIFKMNLVDGDIADLYTIPEKILKKYEKTFNDFSFWKNHSSLSSTSENSSKYEGGFWISSIKTSFASHTRERQVPPS